MSSFQDAILFLKPARSRTSSSDPSHATTNTIDSKSLIKSTIKRFTTEPIIEPPARVPPNPPQLKCPQPRSFRKWTHPPANPNKPLPFIPYVCPPPILLPGPPTTQPIWDPRQPYKEPNMHAHAKEVLTKHYQSKFKLGFDIKKLDGINPRTFDHIWVDPEELQWRVLGDIVWVRERYHQAKMGEPSDEDIIWWFDAGRFDSHPHLLPSSQERDIQSLP